MQAERNSVTGSSRRRSSCSGRRCRLSLATPGIGGIWRRRARFYQDQFALALEDFKAAELMGDDDFLYGPGVIYPASEVFMFMAAAYEELGDYPNAIRCYVSYRVCSGQRNSADRNIRRVEALMQQL